MGSNQKNLPININSMQNDDTTTAGETSDAGIKPDPPKKSLGQKIIEVIESIILLGIISSLILLGITTKPEDVLHVIIDKTAPIATFDFVKVNDSRPPGTICTTEGNYGQEAVYTVLWNSDTIYLYQDMTLKDCVWKESFPGKIESVKCQYIDPGIEKLTYGYTLSVVYKKGNELWLKCSNITNEWFYDEEIPYSLEDLSFTDNKEPAKTETMTPESTKKGNEPAFEHFKTIYDLPIGNMTFIDALAGIHLQSEDKRELIQLDYSGREVSSFDAGNEFIFGLEYANLAKIIKLFIYNGRHYFSFDLKPGIIETQIKIDTGENGILEKSIIDSETTGKLEGFYTFQLYNGIHTFMSSFPILDKHNHRFDVKLDLHPKKVVNKEILMLEDGNYQCFGGMSNKYFPYKFDLIPLIDISDCMLLSNKYISTFFAGYGSRAMLCKPKTDNYLSIVSYSGNLDANKYVETKVNGVDEQVDAFTITNDNDKVDIYLVGESSVYRYSSSWDKISRMKRRLVYMEPTEEPMINIYRQ